MPYIKYRDRHKFKTDTKDDLDELVAKKCYNAGDLNYIISSILKRYIHEKNLSYAVLNEVIGVLECAKLEMYRRVAVPYEDKKIEENGDII